ncbi:MAG: phosphoenolpyruvate--protein phosphotransferase [Deltaproteobacteria bacterium]|nr:phosphoenolpyruvate--protein phosphotransferase [Deltaproteobacteria bacterium]
MSDRKMLVRESGVRKARPRKSHGLAVLEDIGALIGHSHDLQETLENIVKIVAERMGTEVCSLYLFDSKEERLTLWATTGLERAAVGKVTMGVDEGLTGMVIEKNEPVMVVDALAHPRYKYFPETGEERYHSFLGVPIADKRAALGVLVVQTLRRRRFSPHELRLLRAITTQVRGIIVQARLVESLESKEKERQEYRKRMVDAIRRLHVYEKTGDGGTTGAKRRPGQFRLSGAGASPGFGMGHAHLQHSEVSLDDVDERRSDDPEAELQRLADAIERSVAEMVRIKEKMHALAPEVDGALFDAQRMMLEDVTFIGKIESRIRDGAAAESALKDVVAEYVEAFLAMSDGYLRERATDVRDIGQHLLRNLLGRDERDAGFDRDVVLVAHELTLADLSMMEHDHLKGIVLASGGVTSHASILAKSFEIPTVVGVGHVAEVLHEGDNVVVDGNSGVVYVNPSVDVMREYTRLAKEYRAFNLELESIREAKAVTTDGHRVNLYANVGLFGDLHFADLHGAEGVGLYRTEFPFLSYKDFPNEEEQLTLYRKVIERMAGRPVTIRTLDLGADKYPSYLTIGREENPFLGWRSIRISLELPEIFKAQLRAILRAGASGRVRILFPMISSLEELRRVKELLEEARQELDESGQPFDRAMPVGIMIEVPAAVWIAPRLIEEVDFFSIGTNDLIQYLLAVDRNNSKVAPLYEPLHPAVLAAVADVAQAAKDAGKMVGMCGEMASDPLCTLPLIGMGLDDLSMGPFFIPVIKRFIRSVPFSLAEEVARDIRELATAKDVKGYLFERLKELGVIELMDMYH